MDLWVRAQFFDRVARVDDFVTARLEASSIGLDSQIGEAIIEDPSIVASILGISLWVQTTNRVVVIASRSASNLYRVSLSDMEVQELDVLFRGEDDDLRNLSGRSMTDGSLLLLYERGIVCLDPEGFVRWHRLHDDISARIAETDNEIVWVETQWPAELAGTRVGYDLASGQERFK